MSTSSTRVPTAARGRAPFLSHALPLAGAWILVALVGWVGLADVPRVAELTVVNPTEYQLDLRVSSGTSSGTVALAAVRPGATVTTRAVVDQGDTWVVHVTGQGVDGPSFTITRAALESEGWSMVVPAEVGDALRAAGLPPSPPR